MRWTLTLKLFQDARRHAAGERRLTLEEPAELLE
jgi:hypothetical protein